MRAVTTAIDVYDFNHLVAQIHAIDPKWQAPGPSQAGYKIAREKFQAVSAEPYVRPNASQQKWIDVGARQTEIAGKLADFVKKGLARYEDFEFLDDTLPVAERQRSLNVIDARLNNIWEEHALSDGQRARLALLRVGECQGELETLRKALKEALARIGELEQQMAQH